MCDEYLFVGYFDEKRENNAKCIFFEEAPVANIYVKIQLFELQVQTTICLTDYLILNINISVVK